MLVSQRDVLKADGKKAATELSSYTYTYDERGNVTQIDGFDTTSGKKALESLKSAEFEYDKVWCSGIARAKSYS